MGKELLFEFIGTAVLILLGDGVVANVVLKGTKGRNAGLGVVTFAWGFAVFIGACISGPYSRAHLNPAVTIGLFAAGLFKASAIKVIGYIIAQILGGIVGGVLVYVFYKPHFDIDENEDNVQLGIFCTTPAIRKFFWNFISEVIGAFVLVLGITFAGGAIIKGPLPVGLLVVVIGMSLGGTTGYAINPARDLGPRIAHAILPFKHKGSSDWAYAWIPILGPIVGALLAALVYWACH